MAKVRTADARKTRQEILDASAALTEDYLNRIHRLAPTIEAAAPESEKLGRLTPALQNALHEAGIFRMLLPQQFNGAEIDPLTFFHVMEEIAKHDGSTAWCVCQGNGCTMVAAYLPPEGAAAIWADDPKAVLAWGPGPGEVHETEDGYRLTGNWAFASGGRNANWLGAHVPLIAKDGTRQVNEKGRSILRTVLFPSSQAEMQDIWDVIGLRATGSDGYAVENLHVPAEFVAARDVADHRKIDHPLYQFPATSLYAIGFSATAMGIARAMLDAFKELCAEKTPRRARTRLADSPVIQTDVALAEAKLRGARALLSTELEDIWAEVAATNNLTIPQRMRIRLATTHGIHEAKQVADTVYYLGGATSIFHSGAFERRFRDINTVTQQMQGRKDHFETVGAFLLGHPPNLAST